MCKLKHEEWGFFLLLFENNKMKNVTCKKRSKRNVIGHSFVSEYLPACIKHNGIKTISEIVKENALCNQDVP